jgi:hypothetical protein
MAYTYDVTGGLQMLLLLLFLIPAILFLLTQQNMLRRIQPQNRKLMPGLVWLQLIPFLGQLWQFIVIVKIAASLKKELVSRHDDPLFGRDVSKIELGNKRPTLVIGLVYSIAMWSCYLLAVYEAGREVRYPGSATLAGTAAETDAGLVAVGFLALATIACWIAYWIVLAVWARRLKRGPRLAP